MSRWKYDMINIYFKDGTTQHVEASEVTLDQTSLICSRGHEEVQRFERAAVLMYRRKPQPRPGTEGRACFDEAS